MASPPGRVARPEIAAAFADTTTSMPSTWRAAIPKSNGVSIASTPRMRTSFTYQPSTGVVGTNLRGPVTPATSNEPSAIVVNPAGPAPTMNEWSESLGNGHTWSDAGNGGAGLSTVIRPR